MTDSTFELNCISWNKKDLRSIMDAQIRINALILSKNLGKDNIHNMKELLKKIQEDLINLDTSTCSVCGNKQSNVTHMNVEHVKMRMTWGYESDFDCENHSLVLCCKCYSKHILKGPLGKFVEIKRYH